MTGPRGGWDALPDAAAVADELCSLFEALGGDAYDEAVTQTAHALQCALLAASASASDEMVVAALLHDVGHLLVGAGEHASRAADDDLRHEQVGARFLAAWFPAAVTEPVALHVTAKRYLCAVDPGYLHGLSPASRRSLTLQGGPMTPAAADTWSRSTHAQDAILLRRWDDAAKHADIDVPSFRSFEPLLAAAITVR